ncbi:MAG TPA: phosphatidylserine/phosphatidylglycerophosphate/cardiolipin synthase family protein [Oscillatoriaceae cyanobacterium]
MATRIAAHARAGMDTGLEREAARSASSKAIATQAYAADHVALSRSAKNIPPRMSAGNRVTPLVDKQQVLPAVLDTIRNAKHSVQLQSYLFGGKTGQAIADALIERKQAGLDVRVLLDPKLGVVGADDHQAAINALKAHGIEVRTFPLDRLNPDAGWLKQHRAIDHAKLVVADGKVAVAGGMNLSDTGVKAHDYMVRMEGPGATNLNRMFNEDWEIAGGEHFATPAPAAAQGDARIALAESSATRRNIVPLVVSQFDQAQKSIDVEALFLDQPDYVNALIAAHRRGVDVRVLLDKNAIPLYANAVKAGPLMTKLGLDVAPDLPAIAKLRAAGIPVHYYEPHDGMDYLHGKLAVIDGKTTLIGSANFTSQAVENNREIFMSIDDASAAHTFGNVIQDDWAHHSVEAKPLSWFQRRIGSALTWLEKRIYGSGGSQAKTAAS